MASDFNCSIKSFIWRRAIRGSLTLILGVLIYTVARLLFGYTEYRANNFTGILIQEWLNVARPILLVLVPTVVMALRQFLRNTSWIRLIFLVVIAGCIFSLPEYVYNLKSWEPIREVRNRLSIEDETYYHNTARFPDTLSTLGAQFVVRRSSLKTINTTVEEIFATSQYDLVADPTEQNISKKSMLYNIYVLTPEGSEASPFFYQTNNYDDDFVLQFYTSPQSAF